MRKFCAGCPAGRYKQNMKPNDNSHPADRSGMREACGVFAIYAPGEDVARLTYFGIYAMQHRGQESAGIAVSSGNDVVCYKDMGLVTQAFSEKILRILKGDVAVGHVRYSTTGSSVERNAQPITASGRYEIALAHNGNLVNVGQFRDEILQCGGSLDSTTDSEIMAQLIANSDAPDFESAIISCMNRIEGAYSVAILSNGRFYAMRDRLGIRPLCLGKLNGAGWIVASETCALNIVGAEFVREIEPGELIRVDENGPETVHKLQSTRSAMCVFEYIYFARPDSYINGTSLYHARKKMGAFLAKEFPVEADIVIAVPDSGTPAAIGYAQASGIAFEEGLIKNRYVGRTFIQPDQRIRSLGIRIKLNPLKEAVGGKRIVLVDDSIVRGTTSVRLIKMLYDAGAKEIHVRVSSPPVTHPCFYGIDTAEADQLIASGRSVDQVKSLLKPDSLNYLSIESLMKACDLPQDSLCMACFDGCYPIPIPQQLHLDKLTFEDGNGSSSTAPLLALDVKQDMKNR